MKFKDYPSWLKIGCIFAIFAIIFEISFIIMWSIDPKSVLIPVIFFPIINIGQIFADIFTKIFCITTKTGRLCSPGATLFITVLTMLLIILSFFIIGSILGLIFKRPSKSRKKKIIMVKNRKKPVIKNKKRK
ncbi:MAG: hypothetical protein Q8N99_08370 [Nanoarchaeota archaeon]|nr:hypothetical protein [Nanoarchaeota archaeon]